MKLMLTGYSSSLSIMPVWQQVRTIVVYLHSRTILRLVRPVINHVCT